MYAVRRWAEADVFRSSACPVFWLADALIISSIVKQWSNLVLATPVTVPSWHTRVDTNMASEAVTMGALKGMNHNTHNPHCAIPHDPVQHKWRPRESMTEDYEHFLDFHEDALVSMDLNLKNIRLQVSDHSHDQQNALRTEELQLAECCLSLPRRPRNSAVSSNVLNSGSADRQ